MTISRRAFFQTSAAALAVSPSTAVSTATGIDFRFAPLNGQTAFCLPDDHYKSLAGYSGDLRYLHSGALDNFGLVISFGLRGMEQDVPSRQHLESPAVPVIHTRLDHERAFLELTTFATSLDAEGRVDNVLLEVRPRAENSLHAAPVVRIYTAGKIAVHLDGSICAVLLDGRPLLAANAPFRASLTGSCWTLSTPEREATADRPGTILFRQPQEGQMFDRLRAGFDDAGGLLAAARRYWQDWQPFGKPVGWTLPGQYGDFLTACARNIQQAREVKNGKLTFQVGPTVYRGLWVVDGHFLLEAARYLGYDKEAQQGLETTWSLQDADGGIFAGAGRAHWKDTGIAMFSLVRQCELAQDWKPLEAMRPAVLKGAAFLGGLREKMANEGSANIRYGLLPNGMGDGGLGGIRPEFTNTIWALAGLKAVARAAARQKLSGFEPVANFYDELHANFVKAAAAEMRDHPAGFRYLPMLMKEDPQWSAADPWARPRPQSGQWALSHCIYPGLLFPKDDPIVRGHVALMQACTEEDIPAETGWLPHEGVWGYNAMFVAHVYLWAGLDDWARRTFHGFLNHASPEWCWREEQPIRGSLVAGYVGDMPHNWASAECVLYLRHTLALEDGEDLRLLASPGLDGGSVSELKSSPTRFGRVSLRLEPEARGGGWHLEFRREPGPEPHSVNLPSALGGANTLRVEGASVRQAGRVAMVDPASARWSATWRS